MSRSTPFIEVYPYCIGAVNDQRLDAYYQDNPAYCFRKLWFYLKLAIPKFTQPKGIQGRLKYVAPLFNDKSFVSNGNTLVFSTEITGMDLAIITVNDMKVSNATYDSITGDITFTDKTANGDEITVDLYTDGYFLEEINDTEKSILGICFEWVWFTRFSNDWLSITPKAQDKNFKMPNEANKMKSDSERELLIISKLNSAMSDYEQTLAYERSVPNSRRLV